MWRQFQNYRHDHKKCKSLHAYAEWFTSGHVTSSCQDLDERGTTSLVVRMFTPRYLHDVSCRWYSKYSPCHFDILHKVFDLFCALQSDSSQLDDVPPLHIQEISIEFLKIGDYVFLGQISSLRRQVVTERHVRWCSVVMWLKSRDRDTHDSFVRVRDACTFVIVFFYQRFKLIKEQTFCQTSVMTWCHGSFCWRDDLFVCLSHSALFRFGVTVSSLFHLRSFKCTIWRTYRDHCVCDNLSNIRD